MHRLNPGISEVLSIFYTFWLVQISTIIRSFGTQHSGVIWTAVNPNFGLIGFERVYGGEHVETPVESQCKYEPRCEKTGLRGFRPGPTQTGVYSHRRWLEA